MKTSLAVFIVLVIGFFGAGVANAQGMMGGYGYQQAVSTSSQTTATTSDQGDAAGVAILAKLQSGQTSCSQLSDADYAALGEYYEERLMGSYHQQMDRYMARYFGEQNYERMHITMGERLSGCNVNAAYPIGTTGFFPMMMGGWGMMGGYGTPFGYGMMYGGQGYWYNGLLSVALWIFAIIGVVATIRWMMNRGSKK